MKEILNEKIKKIEKVIFLLEEKKRYFKREIEKLEIEEWREKKANGWVPFVYFSSYYGSECGSDGTKLFYAFAPAAADKINLKMFEKVSFSHGDSTMSETNKQFENMLKEIAEDDYDYLDDCIAQAVWPELYKRYQKL
jgi:hypothetical protein